MATSSPVDSTPKSPPRSIALAAILGALIGIPCWIATGAICAQLMMWLITFLTRITSSGYIPWTGSVEQDTWNLAMWLGIRAALPGLIGGAIMGIVVNYSKVPGEPRFWTLVQYCGLLVGGILASGRDILMGAVKRLRRIPSPPENRFADPYREVTWASFEVNKGGVLLFWMEVVCGYLFWNASKSTGPASYVNWGLGLFLFLFIGYFTVWIYITAFQHVDWRVSAANENQKVPAPVPPKVTSATQSPAPTASVPSTKVDLTLEPTVDSGRETLQVEVPQSEPKADKTYAKSESSLPFEKTDLKQLAELFIRSYLILTAKAKGSFPQATAFDDWLESYRVDAIEVLAKAVEHRGCSEAEIEIPGGKVLWWEISDPQIRFLCSFNGDPGYAIPRNGAPVPLIPDFHPPEYPLARIKSIKLATESAPAQPPRKLGVLREKLRDENIMVRLGAVAELEEDGTPNSLPGIREAMKNDHIAVRIQAGYALGRLTEAITGGWAKPLQGSPLPAQIKAIRKLDQLAVLHAAAVPELVHVALTDNHMTAVVFAVTGLCMIGQKAAITSALSVDVFRAASEDSGLSNDVDRLNAAAIAAVLGLEAAKNCRMENARQDVQRTLEVTYRFRDLLMRLGWLFHPKLSSQGLDAPVTDSAEVFKAVERLRTEDADLRSTYVLWLAMRDPVVVAPHVPRIAELLRDPMPGIRESTALALGALGRFAALAVLELRTCCQDSEATVRREAVRSLGKIGPAAGLAVRELTTLAASDPDPQVREAAHEAIRRIGNTFENTPTAHAN